MLKRLALALRVMMETAIVAAFAAWGYHLGSATVGRLLLAIAIPVIGFGIWGAVDFRQAGRLAEPLRLTEELLISGLAAALWYATGQHRPGIALAAVSVTYHGLVYLSGDRLLKHRPKPAAG